MENTTAFCGHDGTQTISGHQPHFVLGTFGSIGRIGNLEFNEVRTEGGVRMKTKNRMVLTLAVFLVVVSVGIGTVIAVTLFYHHMPAVGVAQTMLPNCDPLTATPAIVTVGSSGQITFLCASASPFTVAGSSIIAKPTFLDQGFRTPYTSLWIFNAGGSVVTGSCSARTGAVQLQNNTFMTVPAGNYNYCAEYVDVVNTGLRSFLCRWEA